MAVIDQVITEKYAAYNGDCVDVMQDMPDSSIDFSIYSPPFGGLYHYSSSERDLSNSDSYEQFFEHYEFVINEKARITKPGRMTAVHAADVPTGNSGKNEGMIDFSGDVIRAHERHGWRFVARYTIWKEPLAVRNRTMAKGLAHRTIVNDSTQATNAAADYLLVFRNRGENQTPVAHPTGFDRYAGSIEIPPEFKKYRHWEGDQKENRWSHTIWRRYASSIWDDIRIGRVLPFQDSKEDDDEKHVHPLQLDVIERACVMWSNPGEKVFTPFMGVGSEVYGAVLNGRVGIGVELKESYFKQARLNLADVRPDLEEPELFGGGAEDVAL